MLRVTRLTDYATLLMTLLAAAPSTVHSAAALAERTEFETARAAFETERRELIKKFAAACPPRFTKIIV